MVLLGWMLPLLHKRLHHPHGGAVYRFDEEQIKEMVLEWQCDQRTELLNEILLRAQPLITGVLLSRSKHTDDFDEIAQLAMDPDLEKAAEVRFSAGAHFQLFHADRAPGVRRSLG
jgi:hypothetical protein